MRSCRSRAGRTPSGSNMAWIMVAPTGPVPAAVCWFTSRRGLRLPGPALMSVAQPPAGQAGGDLIEVDHLALEAPPDGQRSRGQVEVGLCCAKILHVA